MAQAPTTLYAVNGPPLTNINPQFQPTPPTLPRAAAERANNLLQLYIIDYCEKHDFRDAAEALRREAQVQPSQRAPVDSREGLLYEWWTCFWEVYTARVHPDRAHSNVAKEYSENLYKGKINSHRDPGFASNQRPAGPSRPYVNGASGHAPPPSVNGHGAPVQYTNTPPGVQNGPGPSSGNSGATPTQLSNNPGLQHLQPQQQQQQQQSARPVNGRSFAGQGMPVGPQPGAPPHPLPQARVMPNGISQTNPNLRQVTAQHSNSPQNQDSNSSPRNPNVSDNANPRPESSDNQKTPRGGRPSRKRGNEDDSTTEKEGATPERKKQKRSPPENGAPLPSTPSLASAQPVGPGRAGFSPFPSKGLGPPPAGMQSMPPQPGPTGAMNPGPPGNLTRTSNEIASQLQQLEAVRASQTDQHQQHFQHMHEQTITAYKPGSGFDPSGQPSRPTTVGPPIGGRGAMGPPPLPGQPPQIPGVTTPGWKPPVNGLLPPAQTGTKDGSPKIDGVSPENTRPASRPAPSTPQQVPSAPTPTGMISTPGGPTAPSPAQLATPQQISRPPTQSPGAPPATVGMGPTASAAATPAALLARGPSAPTPVGGPMAGGFTAIPPANMLNGSIMAPSNPLGGGGGGGPTGTTMGNDSLSDPLFAFDDLGFQMMNFPEQFTNMGNMGFDLSMEDFLQESSLDSITGTGTGA